MMPIVPSPRRRLDSSLSWARLQRVSFLAQWLVSGDRCTEMITGFPQRISPQRSLIGGVRPCIIFPGCSARYQQLGVERSRMARLHNACTSMTSRFSPGSFRTSPLQREPVCKVLNYSDRWISAPIHARSGVNMGMVPYL